MRALLSEFCDPTKYTEVNSFKLFQELCGVSMEKTEWFQVEMCLSEEHEEKSEEELRMRWNMN